MKLWKFVFVGSYIALLVYCYQEYQRRSSFAYFNDPQFVTLLSQLPKSTDTKQRVMIHAGPDQVIVHVEVSTQEEFDRLLEVSKRPGRPSYEKLDLFWKGVTYKL